MDSLDFYWCSDPAIGNASQVVSAIAALAGAIGTIAAFWFAVLRYRDSLNDKRRDQARFVHSYFKDFKVVEEGGSIVAVHRAAQLNLPENVTLDPYVVPETDRQTGREYSRALKRVVFCEVIVENRSDEIVRNVHGQLSVWHATPTGRRTGAIGAWDGFPYLLPESKETFWAAVPYDGPEDSVRDVVDPMLFFTDTNGQTWHRSPFGPPKEMDVEEYSATRGPALPIPEPESPEPRIWSDDELFTAVNEIFAVPTDALVVLERKGRGATLVSDDTVFDINFALNADTPSIVARQMGREIIAHMRQADEADDKSKGSG